MVEAEVAALRRAGNEVELFAAHTDQLEGELLYPLRTAYRVASGRGRAPLAALRAWRPDIVHIHNLFPNFGRRWVEDIEVPLVHTLHNYRPLCAAGTLFRAGGICTLCPDGDQWAGVRHGCYRGSRLATMPVAWANRKGAANDPVIRKADRLIVLSERSRQAYADAGLTPDKMVVWPHFLPDALDLGPQDPEKREGWLFVGRLSEEKGILRLIRHWPEERTLRVVGTGEHRAKLQAASSGKRVELLGSLERSKTMSLMARSWALIVPSICYETFGLVYVEALASGLPVLAIGPNVVADHVRRDRTGWVGSFETIDQDLAKATGEITPLLRDHVRDVFEASYSESALIGERGQLYRDLRDKGGHVQIPEPHVEPEGIS